MKNDLLDSKLYKTKRNLMVYLIVLSVISFLFKFLNGVKIDLRSSLMEFFILAVSLVIFTIQFARIFGTPETDEKMLKERNMINHIGFNILLWGGIGVHFISNLIYDEALLLARNSFTSLIILLGLVVFVISTKKQGFYLNHKHIDKSNKKYYISVLKSLGKIALIGIGYATVVYSLSLSMTIAFDKVLLIFSSILLSFIFFSIEYFMFSIYEKLDYNEKVTYAEEHKRSFLSKKVILFSLPIIGFSIMYRLVFVLMYNIEMSGNVLAFQQATDLLRLLSIWQIDFIVIGLILSFVIYKSIKLLPVEKPNLFKYIPILIWISFAYSIMTYVYQTLIVQSLLVSNVSLLNTISNIQNYLSYAIPVIILSLFIYMYPFLKKNNFPATKALLILPVLPLGKTAIAYLLSNIGFSNSLVYQNVVAQLVMVIIYNLFLYYIMCSMSLNEFKMLPQKTGKEVKKVSLSKKLIH